MTNRSNINQAIKASDGYQINIEIRVRYMGLYCNSNNGFDFKPYTTEEHLTSCSSKKCSPSISAGLEIEKNVF